MALGKLGRLIGSEDSGAGSGGSGKYQELVNILEEIIYQTKLSNTFLFSGWEGVDDALGDLLPILDGLTRNEKKAVKKLDVLFEPKGSLQELATDNGWSADYDRLADRFDAFMEVLEAGGVPAAKPVAAKPAEQFSFEKPAPQKNQSFAERGSEKDVFQQSEYSKSSGCGYKIYRFYADSSREE